MNKKFSMIALLVLAIIIVLMCLSRKTSRYDAACATTDKIYEDGALCFKSDGTVDSTLKTVDDCCNVSGQVWKF
jgi:hypothetical protein